MSTKLARSRYRMGYQACAMEALRYLASSGRANPQIETHLLAHLHSSLQHHESQEVPDEENILPHKLQLAQELEVAAARAIHKEVAMPEHPSQYGENLPSSSGLTYAATRSVPMNNSQHNTDETVYCEYYMQNDRPMYYNAYYNVWRPW